MASSEDGYTKFANELLEALARNRFPGQEYQIMLAVLRLTDGYHKDADTISYGQLSKMTGIDRRKVISLVQSLVSKRALGSAQMGTRKPMKLWINRNFEEWKSSPGHSAQKGTNAQKDTTPSAQKGDSSSAQKGDRPSALLGTHQRKERKKEKYKERGNEKTEAFSSDPPAGEPSQDDLLNRIRNPNVRELVENSIQLIAMTRSTGKVADSVVIRYLKQLLQFEEWKIGTAITRYIEGEYWLDGKGEKYLLGILRNTTARDYHQVVNRTPGKPSDNSQRDPPQPKTYAQARDMERRQRALRLLQSTEEKSDGEQKGDQGGTGSAVHSLPVSGAG
jgi:phage replication O-like protein O